MERAKRQAGLNKLEFSLVVVVIGLIWLVGLNRLLELQEMGEKTAVEMTVSNIRSGLRWEMADRMMTGREPSIAGMAGSNPVRWLEKPPDSYLGEFPAIPERFPPGGWFFDTAQRDLVYRPILRRNLECRQCEKIGADILLRWRIATAGNPMFGRGDRVKIVPVAAYRWF